MNAEDAEREEYDSRLKERETKEEEERKKK